MNTALDDIISKLPEKVGRAAAFLYVKLGVSYVFAPVMAKGAVAILMRHGIEPSFDLEVPGIRNRANDGPCPMEHAVREIADTDVDAAVAAIRTQMERRRLARWRAATP